MNNGTLEDSVREKISQREAQLDNKRPENLTEESISIGSSMVETDGVGACSMVRSKGV